MILLGKELVVVFDYTQNTKNSDYIRTFELIIASNIFVMELNRIDV